MQITTKAQTQNKCKKIKTIICVKDQDQQAHLLNHIQEQHSRYDSVSWSHFRLTLKFSVRHCHGVVKTLGSERGKLGWRSTHVLSTAGIWLGSKAYVTMFVLVKQDGWSLTILCLYHTFRGLETQSVAGTTMSQSTRCQLHLL